MSSLFANHPFERDIVCGLSYRPTPKWNFEFDADYTDWSPLDTITIHQASGYGSLLSQDITSTLNWKPTWYYKFGATRYLENGWSVSAGYIYSENSVPDATFTALVPDSDRHIFSVGIGRRYQHFSWNAGYQLAWGPERDVNTSSNLVFPRPVPALGIGSSANGRYSFLSHALSLNVRYLF